MTREEAINTLGNFKRYISGGGVTDRKANKAIDMAIEALKAEAVQDEAVQEILGYLDDVLHPIVSPDNWYVYSELHDMIEELPFEEPECGCKPKMREKTKYCPNKQEPKTGEWIPVSERLPEEFSVLCCDNHGEMLIANPFECDASDTGFSAENNGCYMYNCIAWMPLPMPYREGREDYELTTEQMEHDVMYEPTYNSEDGSM